MADMFPNAVAYEKLMGRWSEKLAPLFLDFAGVPDGGRILDVGCGTGALVDSVARRASGSSIVGIDPSRPFVDYRVAPGIGLGFAARYAADAWNVMQPRAMQLPR